MGMALSDGGDYREVVEEEIEHFIGILVPPTPRHWNHCDECFQSGSYPPSSYS